MFLDSVRRLLTALALSGLVRSLSFFFFLMIRRPPRSTLDRSSAASDVYKRQEQILPESQAQGGGRNAREQHEDQRDRKTQRRDIELSLIHISEPTRPY